MDAGNGKQLARMDRYVSVMSITEKQSRSGVLWATDCTLLLILPSAPMGSG